MVECLCSNCVELGSGVATQGVGLRTGSDSVRATGWGRGMRKFGAVALALAVPGGIGASQIGASQSAQAADASAPMLYKAPYDCRAPDAPYKNYACLDKYLGDDFFTRLVNYYRL